MSTASSTSRGSASPTLGKTRVISDAPFVAIPRPPRAFIPRPRVDRALDEATRRPLTVVVAPAGSGKTAAVAGWAAETGDVRWVDAQAGESASLLDAALQASRGRPHVVVVDDAHKLTTESWRTLDAALTAAPDQVRVVIVTRRDIPFPTVALELSDALTVLRADALWFDDDEARQLVVAHAPDASEEDMAAVQGRAKGWAAALVLGARSLAGAPDRVVARAALEHTEQPVLDYLLGEVFETMRAGTRHVLLCTVDEPTVTARAAVLLSGDPDAPNLLNELASEGMLVEARDAAAEIRWAYHPLLRELLRRQVAVDGPAHALAVAAHARAAHHHALHGPAVDAVRHAIAAGEHQLLGELLVERGPALLCSGQEECVAEALQALPDDVAAQPAMLGVTALLLRSVGDREQAMRVATLAARAARLTRAGLGGNSAWTGPADSALLADAALLNAWMARLGWHDVDAAVTDARWVVGEAADGSLDDALDRPPLEPARLSWLLHELAVLETWTGDLAAAARHCNEALLTAEAVSNDRLSAAALADRCVLQLLDGRFQTAADTARDCLAAAGRAGRLHDGYIGRAYLALGWAAFYDLRLDEAASALEELRRSEGHDADHVVAALAEVLAARLVAETGQVERARQMLAAAPPRPEPAPPYLAGVYALVRAYWALVDRDLSEVARQVPMMHDVGWEVSAAAFEAVVANLDGRPEVALDLLERALALPAEGEQLVCAAFAAAYKARLLLEVGRNDEAREALRDALSRAAPQRLLHPLLAGAAAGPEYLAVLAELTVEPDAHPFAEYADDAADRYCRAYPDPSRRATPAPSSRSKARVRPGIAAVRLPHHAEPVTPRVTPHPMPPLPLTGREAEVLRELALGGSYHDVARVLYVTDNTVKTHVSALYRKLGVERRADALRRARELGLLRGDVALP